MDCPNGSLSGVDTNAEKHDHQNGLRFLTVAVPDNQGMDGNGGASEQPSCLDRSAPECPWKGMRAK